MPAPKTRFKDAYARARAMGYRSGLEERVSKSLTRRGCTEYEYEPGKLPFLVPARQSTYTPDFILPNGIVVETKGRWVTEDRKKMRLLVDQYPGLDIRLVFSRSLTTISKKSETTYGMVATKLGVPFADRDIPDEWLEEPINETSSQIIREIMKT